MFDEFAKIHICNEIFGGNYQWFARKNKINNKNEPSVLAILQQQLGKQFSFQIIPKEEFEKKILNLNYTKPSKQLDILTK